MITLADIEAARDRIAGGVYLSPCVESIPLSQLTGAHIYCKLDYLQRTGSFKERGARNALLLLTPEQKQARGDRRLCGQSRARHRLSRQPARHSDHRRDAEIRRAGQGHELPSPGRQRHPARRRPDRSARVRGRARRARRPHVHPSVRQRKRDRRPGDDRARDPRAGARRRGDRRARRRRRPHRRASASSSRRSSPASKSSASSPRRRPASPLRWRAASPRS